MRHYLAGNFSLSRSASTLLNTSTVLVNSSASFGEYSRPAPAAGSGVHRYVYLLYVQPATFNRVGFEAAGLSPTNRTNFNVRAFVCDHFSR